MQTGKIKIAIVASKNTSLTEIAQTINDWNDYPHDLRPFNILEKPFPNLKSFDMVVISFDMRELTGVVASTDGNLLHVFHALENQGIIKNTFIIVRGNSSNSGMVVKDSTLRQFVDQCRCDYWSTMDDFKRVIMNLTKKFPSSTPIKVQLPPSSLRATPLQKPKESNTLMIIFLGLSAIIVWWLLSRNTCGIPCQIDIEKVSLKNINDQLIEIADATIKHQNLTVIIQMHETKYLDLKNREMILITKFSDTQKLIKHYETQQIILNDNEDINNSALEEIKKKLDKPDLIYPVERDLMNKRRNLLDENEGIKIKISEYKNNIIEETKKAKELENEKETINKAIMMEESELENLKKEKYTLDKFISNLVQNKQNLEESYHLLDEKKKELENTKKDIEKKLTELESDQ